MASSRRLYTTNPGPLPGAGGQFDDDDDDDDDSDDDKDSIFEIAR